MKRGFEKTLKSAQRVFLFVCLVTAVAASAQTPEKNNTDNPVAQARGTHGWEYGPFIDGGFGLGDRASYRFLSAGGEIGKTLTPVIHAGIFSGQFQAAANFMPLWQAYTPAPHLQEYTCATTDGGLVPCLLPTGGGTFRGVSLTPIIFRWNFLTSYRRVQPWFQAAGGLIYTTREFPPNLLSNRALGIDGSTSVWNFTPQGGIGVHYFLRDGRSIDLGLNAVHISSASLGDRNPGVNALLQIQAGYTFWNRDVKLPKMPWGRK